MQGFGKPTAVRHPWPLVVTTPSPAASCVAAAVHAPWPQTRLAPPVCVQRNNACRLRPPSCRLQTRCGRGVSVQGTAGHRPFSFLSFQLTAVIPSGARCSEWPMHVADGMHLGGANMRALESTQPLAQGAPHLELHGVSVQRHGCGVVVHHVHVQPLHGAWTRRQRTGGMRQTIP